MRPSQEDAHPEQLKAQVVSFCCFYSIGKTFTLVNIFRYNFDLKYTIEVCCCFYSVISNLINIAFVF